MILRALVTLECNLEVSNDAVDISTLTSPVIESTANAFANGYYNDLYGYINLNPGESIEIQIVQADSSSAFVMCMPEKIVMMGNG